MENKDLKLKLLKNVNDDSLRDLGFIVSEGFPNKTEFSPYPYCSKDFGCLSVSIDSNDLCLYLNVDFDYGDSMTNDCLIFLYKLYESCMFQIVENKAGK